MNKAIDNLIGTIEIFEINWHLFYDTFISILITKWCRVLFGGLSFAELIQVFLL